MLKPAQNKKLPGGIEEPGSYLVLLLVEKPFSLRVGKLGIFHFACGTYAYAGSARGGLKKRIARHLGRRNKCFWHIDYLLSRAEVRIDKVLLFPAELFPEIDEHILSKKLLQSTGREAIKGFGSSDCQEKCPGHLIKISPQTLKDPLLQQAITLRREELEALVQKIPAGERR